MNILILKLILAPIIIGGASWAGRKWGGAVSGWIVGLPLTSGPVAFFLAISHDKIFTYNVIRGTLSGGFSLVAFTLTYAWMAKKFNWGTSILTSLFVFALMTALMQNIIIPFIPLFFAVVIVIFSGLKLMPAHRPVQTQAPQGIWDIPTRILIGTSFILLITTSAPYIGARLTGLLTTIPLYVTILTVFAHRHQGTEAAIHVLQGLLLALFSFAGFFLTLGLLIQTASIALAFGAAICATLGIQLISFFVLQRQRR